MSPFALSIVVGVTAAAGMFGLLLALLIGFRKISDPPPDASDIWTEQ